MKRMSIFLNVFDEKPEHFPVASVKSGKMFHFAHFTEKLFL
jgi:hypothetical protein